MKILNHPSCTELLGAPSDMQDGSCAALPVRYEETEYGTFAVSYWQPEPQDLAALLAKGYVVLGVRAQGRQHPVVFVDTGADAPPEDKSDLEGAALYGILESTRKMAENLVAAERVVHNQKVDIARLQSEIAHLKTSLELADALRNRDAGLTPEGRKARFAGVRPELSAPYGNPPPAPPAPATRTIRDDQDPRKVSK